MIKGTIIIISGPSGSGKTTLHKKLLLSKRLKNKLVKSISATTRLPRSGEKRGRDYLFISLPQFKGKIKAGYFLEWQKVFDNYYGTPIHSVEKLLSKGKNVLLCIDVRGAKVVSRKYPDAIKIFIKAPSMNTLKKRLISRGTESKNDLKLRLVTVRNEMREARKYDHVIVNDNLSKAYKMLEMEVLRALKN